VLAAAAAKCHSQSCNDQEADDQSRERPILTRPLDSDAFARPETTERTEHHADREFEGVFRDEGERFMQCESQQDDRYQRDTRPDAGGQQLSARGPDRHHDEDDLDPLQHDNFEGGDKGTRIPA